MRFYILDIEYYLKGKIITYEPIKIEKLYISNPIMKEFCYVYKITVVMDSTRIFYFKVDGGYQCDSQGILLKDPIYILIKKDVVI